MAEEFRADWEACNIDFYEDVAYGIGGDHPMYLDLMIPNETPKGKRPVIIWVHGGGWSIKELTKKYRPVSALVQACQMGFVCASIEYRLVTEKPFPAPLPEDTLDLVSGAMDAFLCIYGTIMSIAQESYVWQSTGLALR